MLSWVITTPNYFLAFQLFCELKYIVSQCGRSIKIFSTKVYIVFVFYAVFFCHAELFKKKMALFLKQCWVQLMPLMYDIAMYNTVTFLKKNEITLNTYCQNLRLTRIMKIPEINYRFTCNLCFQRETKTIEDFVTDTWV